MRYKKNIKILFFCCFLYHTISFFAFSCMFFTPRDDLKAKLIELIDQECRSIDAAVYMFTDKDIASAIIRAYVRGVRIRLILDQISMGEQYGKGCLLKRAGIKIFVFKSDRFKFYSIPIMHNKFFVFGYNAVYKKSLIWTGSYNCTASASRLHCENVVVSDDIGLCKDYKDCFETLLQHKYII